MLWWQAASKRCPRTRARRSSGCPRFTIDDRKRSNGFGGDREPAGEIVTTVSRHRDQDQDQDQDQDDDDQALADQDQDQDQDQEDNTDYA
jgi:hypothetical protein